MAEKPKMLKIYKDISEKPKNGPNQQAPGHPEGMPYTSIANNLNELTPKNANVAITLDRMVDSKGVSVPKKGSRTNFEYQDNHKNLDFHKKKYRLENELSDSKDEKSMLGETLLMESNLLSDNASHNVSTGKG